MEELNHQNQLLQNNTKRDSANQQELQNQIEALKLQNEQISYTKRDSINHQELQNQIEALKLQNEQIS